MFATVCSGIGAPELAADKLGWNCLFQAEIEPFPRSVLKHHFPEVHRYKDFTDIDPRKWVDRINCMVAGTPCQDFSTAGGKAGITGRRGGLTLDYVRLVQKTRCPWGIMENVPRLLSKDFGHVLNAITGRDDLHGFKEWTRAGFVEAGPSGYSAAWRLLNARHFGVPQKRRRLFLVFHHGDWGAPVSVLYEPTSGGGHSPKDAGGENPAETQDRPDAQSEAITDISVYEHHRMAGRLREIDQMYTLPAYMGTGGGNKPIVLDGQTLRYATPIEIERSFGFPDSWTDVPAGVTASKRYKALGNSMAVPVMRWLLERLDICIQPVD